MKKLTLIILAIILSLPAFANKQHRKKKQKAGNEIISVTLKRTGCYGRCRIYSIEVNKDGMAIYTATRFNLDSGVFTKRIGASKSMEIINQFNTYRVDTCKDLYESRVQDVPGFAFIIKYQTKTKTIADARFGPPFLSQLGRELDALVGEKADDSWHRSPSSEQK